MTTPDPAPPAAATGNAKTALFKLEHPIKREGGDLAESVLRKPSAGDLRGLNATALMQGDINSVIALLPRISNPFISDEEAVGLEAEDIMEAAGLVVGFFMTKAQRIMVEQMTGRSSSKT